MNHSATPDADNAGLPCVLLPCSRTERWAVPHNALAEIVALTDDSDLPPAEFEWRGQSVPVLDICKAEAEPWSAPTGGSGLVAVFLGLQGMSCDYWGIALRGEGLAIRDLALEALADEPDQVLDHARGAFSLDGLTYQVPDLLSLQQRAVQRENP